MLSLLHPHPPPPLLSPGLWASTFPSVKWVSGQGALGEGNTAGSRPGQGKVPWGMGAVWSPSTGLTGSHGTGGVQDGGGQDPSVLGAGTWSIPAPRRADSMVTLRPTEAPCRGSVTLGCGEGDGTGVAMTPVTCPWLPVGSPRSRAWQSWSWSAGMPYRAVFDHNPLRGQHWG